MCLVVVSVVAVGAGIVCILWNHGAVGVRKTTDGWTCDGPVEFENRPAITRPVVCGKNLIVLERYIRDREGLMRRRVRMAIPRDSYYVTSLRLEDGRGVFRRKMMVEGFPLQVRGLWAWGEKTVIWGFHQGKSSTKRFSWILVLDPNGKTAKRFNVSLPLEIMAVDQTNDLLLCFQKWDDTVLRIQKDPYEVVGLDLPSGTVKFSVPAPLAFDIVADENGNAYVMSRVKSGRRGDAGVYDALLEKYSVVPWKKLWSVEIEGTEESYPRRLLYQQDLLWYALYEDDAGSTPQETIIWSGGPLDPDTAEYIETELRCNPYKMQVEVEGKKYTITRDGGGVRVKTDRG